MNDKKRKLMRVAESTRIGCIVGISATFFEWCINPNPAPRLMEDNIFPLLMIIIISYVIDAIIVCSDGDDA